MSFIKFYVFHFSVKILNLFKYDIKNDDFGIFEYLNGSDWTVSYYSSWYGTFISKMKLDVGYIVTWMLIPEIFRQIKVILVEIFLLTKKGPSLRFGDSTCLSKCYQPELFRIIRSVECWQIKSWIRLGNFFTLLENLYSCDFLIDKHEFMKIIK